MKIIIEDFEVKIEAEAHEPEDVLNIIEQVLGITESICLRHPQQEAEGIKQWQ